MVKDAIGDGSSVARLSGLNTDQLRLQWRNHLGGVAPAHLPGWLLLRVLAYRGPAAVRRTVGLARSAKRPQAALTDSNLADVGLLVLRVDKSRSQSIPRRIILWIPTTIAVPPYLTVYCSKIHVHDTQVSSVSLWPDYSATAGSSRRRFRRGLRVSSPTIARPCAVNARPSGLPSRSPSRHASRSAAAPPPAGRSSSRAIVEDLSLSR